MELYWTSKKSINGLRHFVLINKYIENENEFLVFVSVLDDKVSLKISRKEFDSSKEWDCGWLKLEKFNAITENYFRFKEKIKNEKIESIYLNNDSPFNVT